MELTLVHPDDKATKVVVTSSIQAAAYRSQGFVEQDEFDAMTAEAELSTEKENAVEELAKLKAENKALKSENTKLKNKLAKHGVDSEGAEDEPNGPKAGSQPEGEKDETK